MTVVAFRKNEKNAQIIEVDETKFKELIVLELTRKYHAGVKIKYIANKTGLCIATISKLVNGETPSPQVRTMMKIAKFLKIKIFMQI